MAAALLLKDEGANVTVLDSAEENKLLKSTVDNLRLLCWAHNQHVAERAFGAAFMKGKRDEAQRKRGGRARVLTH